MADSAVGYNHQLIDLVLVNLQQSTAIVFFTVHTTSSTVRKEGP